jgi:predicted Zn-dependent protease
MLKTHRTLGLAALTIVMVGTGCATNPVSGEKDFVLMSEDQELQVGQQYHQQVLKQMTVYEDPELQTYVNRIGQEIAEKSHRNELIYRFTVLDSPTVNAFALPGGYIYITRGILAYMNSEAHLAGVLGHEVGHVTARHAVRQHSTGTLLQILGAAAAVGTGSQAVGDLSNMFGSALIRGYGRKMELEADRLGAEYLANTGYDPDEMMGVIGILKSQEQFEIQRAKEEGREPRGYHGVFATHPANDRRLQEVIGSAKNLPSSGTRSERRDVFLRYLDGMVFGSGEAQGVLRGSDFYHRQLDFTVAFPPGWRVENQPDQLLAVSRGNDAVIRVTLRDLNRRQTPEQFLRKEFDDLRQGEAFTTESFAGYTGIAQLSTPFGRKYSRVATTFHDDRAFIIASASKKGLVDKPFFNTVRSFRRLRPDEYRLTESRRIRLVRAAPGDTFAQLARSSGLGNYAEAQLRLLNDMYPSGEPRPGQWIKIVR